MDDARGPGGGGGGGAGHHGAARAAGGALRPGQLPAGSRRHAVRVRAGECGVRSCKMACARVWD